MSDGRVPLPAPKKKRYSYGDRVLYKKTNQKGIVLRRREDQYTVKLEDGSRVHCTFVELELAVELINHASNS